MNLKVKYNAFMAEHPLLRGGAWLTTKLFMLTLVAVLFVLGFLLRVIGGSNRDYETTEYDPGENLTADEKMARGLGYSSVGEMYEKDDHFN
jgi:hypothetical protein